MILKGLEYLAIMVCASAFALGYMLFFMEWLPRLRYRPKHARSPQRGCKPAVRP
jgi:hypothetical protein